MGTQPYLFRMSVGPWVQDPEQADEQKSKQRDLHDDLKAKKTGGFSSMQADQE